jgi:hypothetical protein
MKMPNLHRHDGRRPSSAPMELDYAARDPREQACLTINYGPAWTAGILLRI